MKDSPRLWRALGDHLSRGWRAVQGEGRALRKIERWSWEFWGEPPNRVPVHILAGAHDWRLAAWMLASWFHASRQGWQVVVHDDGTLPEEADHLLQRLFSKCRIIPRAEADAALDRVLPAFPFCEEFRKLSPRAMKLFDVPHFTTSDPFLLFDPELLFFHDPREILAWTASPGDACWFLEGATEQMLISSGEAREEFGVKPWPRVHSGLGLLQRRALDLDFCDRVLAQTSILKGDPRRAETTLFALCASRRGHGGTLPRRYEIATARSLAKDAAARLYEGSTRNRFIVEGIPRVRPKLFGPSAD